MKVWFDGKDNYKKHSYDTIDSDTRNYTLEYIDVDYDSNISLFDEFYENVQNRNTKKVEVLYSGGIDSELVLFGLLRRNVPVIAITMRLISGGITWNTHDLYYAEKFCREHNITQKIVDLEVDKFFDNGDYLAYLSPYQITQPHVATHFWLFEQCSDFPIIGGEYSWPQVHHGSTRISPTRYEYANYDRYLKDKGISGIGNMLGNSLAIQSILIQKHISIIKTNNHIEKLNPLLQAATIKAKVYQELGYDNLEKRLRSYGWESISRSAFNAHAYLIELKRLHGTVLPEVIWGAKFATILGSSPGSNTLFK